MDPQIDEQVAKLLGGLKKVEAPRNFESRVMARLSTPRSVNSRFGFLKLAVPAAVLAGIAMFLFLSGYVGSDVPTVNVVSTENEGVETQAPRTDPQEQAVSESNPQPPVEFRGSEPAEGRPSPKVAQPKDQPSFRDKRLPDGRGSHDFGSGDGGGIKAPGLNMNSRPGPDPDMERLMRRPTILASDVLRYTGVTAEFRGNGWTVSSVTQKSVAERIGLKAGDVIVSLNDVRLGKATSFPSGVDIKMIRVNRGGRTVDLKF